MSEVEKEMNLEAQPEASPAAKDFDVPERPTLATVWLDACSGCHMSLLDLDETLVEILGKVQLVYSPIMDIKKFPEHVDGTIIEGAVGNDEDAEKVYMIRKRTDFLISLGDCAVTANVPAMRNQFKVDDVLRRAYVENATHNAQIPTIGTPHLLRKARPVHEFVRVDVFLPGCPPPPESILYILSELMNGRLPDPKGRTRFGA
jgi:NAD-reducing hydrogenase small subunit